MRYFFIPDPFLTVPGPENGLRAPKGAERPKTTKASEDRREGTTATDHAEHAWDKAPN